MTLSSSVLPVENVPEELRDPFYCDQYEQEHLKPPVTRLLLSPELYCRTYSLLLGQGQGQGPSGAPVAEGSPKDNGDLLQILSKRGLVAKDKNVPITDEDLRHKPIKMVRKWVCLCVCGVCTSMINDVFRRDRTERYERMTTIHMLP